jgi:hypothetical protein
MFFDEMSGENKGIKRARTQEQQDGTDAAKHLTGREQLLLTSPELQTRFGRKFVDETEVLSLLLTHGFIRRVRTILIEVRPLGGDSLKVTLDASKPTVGEAKAEIARSQGTAAGCQELYRVAERADGLAVREDDAEPELLDDESMVLEDGDVVAMAVKVRRLANLNPVHKISDLFFLYIFSFKPLNDDAMELGDGETVAMGIGVKESPLVWSNCDEERVALSEGGAVATLSEDVDSGIDTLVTSGVQLTVGTHYWEVELLSDSGGELYVGVARPNLPPNEDHAAYAADAEDGDGDTVWFIHDANGCLFGNGNYEADEAGRYIQGDRVGMLLDLDNGSLRFFKNGVQHGPGYPAGSVTGPVVAAVQIYGQLDSVRLLPDAKSPAGV